METPVRYYITQDDDRPVVRTVPVAKHPLPRVIDAAVVDRGEEPTVSTVPACSVPAKRGPVRRIVRAAVRRAHRETS